MGTFLEKTVCTFKKIHCWYPNQIFFTEFFWETFDPFSTLKNEFESKLFEIFDKVVYNSGKSDDDIKLKKYITVKLRAVDRATIQFWNFLAKGHST